MVKFVIVEDNQLHMNLTEEMILKYMMNNNYDFDILKYLIPNSSFNNIIDDDNNYIYILDFDLGNTNAIEVARKIRKKDWKSPIIVFSVNGGMAYETFKQRLQILDFVNKQFEAEKNMFELFDICFEQLGVHSNLKYKIGKIDYVIDFDKILYIYKDTMERKSIIVTNNGEYKVPMTLIKTKELLPSYFKYSHKSCIINVKRKEAIDWSKKIIIFDNGIKCDLVSKKYKEGLR